MIDSQKSYDSFCNRARSVMLKYSSNQEMVDDFPSFAIEMKLRNPARTWHGLVVDFMRYFYGRVDIKDDIVVRRSKPHVLYAERIEADTVTVDINPIEALYAKEFVEKLHATKRINKRDLSILLLHHMYSFSQKEIGDMFSLTESRVNQIITKTIKLIRRLNHLNLFSR